jgi:thioredoxin/glutathione reductase (selenoprotein)
LAGINIDKSTPHNWTKMVQSVQKHIKSLNWGYKSDLIGLKVKYYNFYASFLDQHTLLLEDGKGK